MQRGGGNTRTIVIQSPWNAAAVEREIPRLEEGETLLKMICDGICGSDLASYRRMSAYVSCPRTIGHEFAAEVVKTGDNVYGIKPGMIITGNPYFNYGTRYSCRRGTVNCCVYSETMGVQREGAFSNYLTTPVGRLYDDQGIDPRELVLIEPFCINHYRVSWVSVEPSGKALVFGAGTIEVLAGVVVRGFGARVYITDIAREKVEAAVRDLHLDSGFVNESRERPDMFVQEVTNGDGFDVAVEAVDAPSTFLGCVQAAASRGHAVMVGVAKHNADFNFLGLQRKELEMYDPRTATTADFVATMKLVKGGFVDLKKLISRTYPVGSAAETFRDLDQDYGEVIRAGFEL